MLFSLAPEKLLLKLCPSHQQWHPNLKKRFCPSIGFVPTPLTNLNSRSEIYIEHCLNSNPILISQPNTYTNLSHLP